MTSIPDTPKPADLPAGFDLRIPHRIHLIGAGGAGMSSIATILIQMGHTVSGSDASESKALIRLTELGMTAFVGHRRDQIGDAQMVLRSTAVRPDNPEYLEALDRGIPVLNRTAFLPLLGAVTPFLSISGTHGKTTTSSMTAVALTACGAEPSFLIGSPVHSLGASAGYRSGPLMVLEADESDGSFMAGPRAGAIVTNIEPDHLDYWGSWDALVDGFREFLAETEGPRVVCVDEAPLASMKSELGAIGYGFDESAEYRVLEVSQSIDATLVKVFTPQGPVSMRLAVPGRYNALNATAALALVHSLGKDLESIIAGLESYRGVARRFERRGSLAGIDFVDDYAHHPTELRAVIGAAGAGEWDRVVAVFQPHRFTRTESLWDDFAGAFNGIDLLVVTEIYPAGEPPRPGITGNGLADAIRAGSEAGQVVFAATLDEAAAILAEELRSGDLAMSLGAGDVTTMSDKVIALIESAGNGHGSAPKGSSDEL